MSPVSVLPPVDVLPAAAPTVVVDLSTPIVEAAAEEQVPIVGEALWHHTEALLRWRAAATAGLGPRPLFIFDWDDTLHPTTSLTEEGHFALPTVPFEQRAEMENYLAMRLEASRGVLGEVSDMAGRVLAKAQTLGEVVIVTNAIQGWVQSTANRFIPGLAPALQTVPVISARSIYEPQGIADPARWKALTFQRIAQCLGFGQPGGPLHFISVGDSWHERAAALEMPQALGAACFVKSMKLLERPSKLELAAELDVCAEWLEHLALHDGFLDLNVREWMKVENLVLPMYTAPEAYAAPASVEEDLAAAAAVPVPETPQALAAPPGLCLADMVEGSPAPDAIEAELAAAAHVEAAPDADEVEECKPKQRRCDEAAHAKEEAVVEAAPLSLAEAPLVPPAPELVEAPVWAPAARPKAPAPPPPPAKPSTPPMVKKAMPKRSPFGGLPTGPTHAGRRRPPWAAVAGWRQPPQGPSSVRAWTFTKKAPWQLKGWGRPTERHSRRNSAVAAVNAAARVGTAAAMGCA